MLWPLPYGNSKAAIPALRFNFTPYQKTWIFDENLNLGHRLTVYGKSKCFRAKRWVNSEIKCRLDRLEKKKETLTDRARWCQDQGAPGIMIQSAWAVGDMHWHLSTSALPAMHDQCNTLSIIMVVSFECLVTAIKLSGLVFRILLIITLNG